MSNLSVWLVRRKGAQWSPGRGFKRRRSAVVRRSSRIQSLLVLALIAGTTCRDGAVPPAAIDRRSPATDMVALAKQAAESDVTYQVVKGSLVITLSDDHGVGNYQVTAHMPAPGEDASVEAIGPTGKEIRHPCPRRRDVTLGPSNNHNGHPHRVIWTDCRGRAHARRGQVNINQTELWEIVDLTSEPTQRPPDDDLAPLIVDVLPHQHAFRGVLVGHSFNGSQFDLLPCATNVTKVFNALKNNWGTTGWANLAAPITQAAATKATITAAVNTARTQVAGDPDGPGPAQGDDFLFYYCNHGLNGPGDLGPADEPDGRDGQAGVAPDAANPLDRMYTDDELATLLSGFRAGAKITVVLDVCFAGDFVQGFADLLNIRDDRQTPLDAQHLAVMMAARECEPTINAEFTNAVALCLGAGATTVGNASTTQADGQSGTATGNRDGHTTAEELFNCARGRTTRSNPTLGRGPLRRT